MIEGHVVRLRACRREVAARIRDEILRETPAYGRLPYPEADAWAGGIEDLLAMFLDTGISGCSLTDDQRAAMEAIGRTRAEQGVPLNAIAASIAVAARVVRDWALGHAGALPPEERDALSVISQRATSFANAITSAALGAYVARKEGLATSLEQAKARLFDRLLNGRFDDEGAVVHEADAVGCDLRQPWMVVLIPTSAGGMSDRLEADAIEALPRAVIVPMASTKAPHAALMAPCPDDAERRMHEALDDLARTHDISLLRIGPCRGVGRLQRSYRTARTLVPYLDGLVGPGAVVDSAEHWEAALLAAVPREIREAYLADVLGGLEREPRDRARRLLRTLEVLVHSDSLKAAANVLGVNVKTVRRRLAALERLCGLRMDRPEDLHRARTAITLRQLSLRRAPS